MINNSLSTSSVNQRAHHHHGFKKDMASLGTALQSGDLVGAQKALASIQQNTPIGAKPPVGFDALTKAVSSGDVNAAKDAFAEFQKSIQARFAGKGASLAANKSNDHDADDAGGGISVSA